MEFFYEYNETDLEAYYKEVIDSLPDIFQDDPTNLNMILQIVQMNQNMAVVVTEENSEYDVEQ